MTNSRRFASLLVGFGLICLSVGYLVFSQPASVIAQEATEETETVSSESVATGEVTGNNSFCLLCHADNAATKTLADGTELTLGLGTVGLAELDGSVHGSRNEAGALGCVDCHGADAFPHDDPVPETGRAYTVQKSLACTNCHTDQTENLADDVHYTAITDGNLDSASCVDCHGSHDVQPPDASAALISQTCGDCHTTTFSEYRDSVHGEALFAGDDNAPNCVSCHGVHGIQHPTTALFRNRSPELCADCHADEELMAQYDISTNVFDSYLSDFHGTTVSLFEQSDPNVPTNKAVCYDCHGVHDITRADDSKGQVVRENLLTTCRECHPDANADFPDTWVGHFEPTFESHPILFAVNLFYDLLIPGVVGAFVMLIGVDVFGRVRRRGRRGGTE